MKEKPTTSPFKRILVNCGAQAKEYGGCVAAKIPEVERDMCLKEFLALKNCMKNVDLIISRGIQNSILNLEVNSIMMSGKASSSQSTVSFGGSGALSHAYIQYPPLRCNVDGSRGLFYDDGNKLLISPTSDQVISWKTSPFCPDIVPTSDTISMGPLLAIRYSLDGKIIAIQRSNHEVQFWNKETGDTFSHRCRSESDNILGFFWTDCSTCDIVFVKTSGLDLCSYDSESNCLHLAEAKKMIVSWYVYTHESRLVLLASGMQCKSFTGYQLSSAGIIKLPRFEMAMAKSEANSKPVLAAEDVHIITVYGRIYCFQVDRVAMLLHSYRFYRDAVIPQGSLPVYSSKIALSVVDNVLLVHQVDAKVVILYDIFSDAQSPISAPLPLLLRGFPRTSISSSHPNRKDVESSEPRLRSADSSIYGDDWSFLVPDLICDIGTGFLWKIHLDLEAISASSSDVPSVLEFLQRRKLEAKKAKQLCFAVARSIIIERSPLPVVFRAIDVLVTSYSYSIKTGTYKGMRPDKASSSDVNVDTVADRPIRRADTLGKSVKGETVNDSSLSTSESEDKTYFEKKKYKARDTQHSGDGENLISAELSFNTQDKSLASQSQSLGPGNQPLNDVSEQQDLEVTSAAIAPDELYSFLFAPVEEEMTGDVSYLLAVIVEFLRSCNLEKVKVHPSIYVLTVRLLARSERYAELGLFIINKIVEPSKEVAMQLLESGRQNFQTRKLGLGMLRQLLLHHDYVVLLVQDGYYLEALRHARKYKKSLVPIFLYLKEKLRPLFLRITPLPLQKVNTVRPSLFLEAACSSNDSQHLAAVLRFFSDFIPGFKDTSDHHTYCRALTEMNLSVTA